MIPVYTTKHGGQTKLRQDSGKQIASGIAERSKPLILEGAPSVSQLMILPMPASKFPELAGLCGGSREQMTITGWQFDGNTFLMRQTIGGTVFDFRLQVVDRNTMRGAELTSNSAMPQLGYTQKKQLQLLRVGQ